VTRIINVSGNLEFGDVPVGTTRDATITIGNSGNGVLNVTGITVSGGFSELLTASWTSGTIAAGASQPVTIRFAPTQTGAYNGTLTVNADHTSGTNTLAVSANATAGFAGDWAGAHRITACNGTGSLQDLLCSANHGVYPVGTLLTFALTLQQDGANVTGTVNLGGLLGPVSGTVVGGVLSLRGTATGSGFTAEITVWNTTVQGASMVGQVNYNLTLTGILGVAGIESQLDSVTRQ